MSDSLTSWRNGVPFVRDGFGSYLGLTAWRNGVPFVRWETGGAPPAGSSIPAIYDYYRRLRCA